MTIKFILIAFLLIATIFIVRHHDLRVRAITKLAFIFFLLFSIFAILFPESLTITANHVGVGRGADLLLYALVISFVFVTISIYLQLKRQQTIITKLIRQIAIRDAEEANKTNRTHHEKP